MYVNYLAISVHIYIIKCPIITYPEWLTYQMFKFSTTSFRSLYNFEISSSPDWLSVEVDSGVL